MTARKFVALVLLWVSLSAASFADAARPEIGRALDGAMHVMQTRQLNDCPESLAKLHEAESFPDPTDLEAKTIHDLGKFVVTACDYAEHHDGKFSSTIP